MHFTQRQINTGIFSLIIFSSLILCLYYTFNYDPAGQIGTLAGMLVTSVLLLAYRRNWEYARHCVVIAATLIIPFAMTGNALTKYFHPLLFLPVVVALVLTNPIWVIGSALCTYGIMLLRANWDGFHSRPEIIIAYLIVVGGLAASRLATDSAQHLADANARADTERERAEQALERVSLQTHDLQQALDTIAERERSLAGTLAELQATEAVVRALSAPMLPVLPGVLVAPLIGAIDSERATVFAANLLQAIERQRACAVIFDVTGVPIIDTQVAQVLLDAAAAARLLGTQVALVGLRPEIAQTLVALGLPLTHMTPYANLQQAVRAFDGKQERRAAYSYAAR